MLPFLKNNREASVSLPSKAIKREPDEEGLSSLEVICAEFLDAVHVSDVKKMAQCLEAAFDSYDRKPQQEGEPI